MTSEDIKHQIIIIIATRALLSQWVGHLFELKTAFVFYTEIFLLFFYCSCFTNVGTCTPITVSSCLRRNIRFINIDNTGTFTTSRASSPLSGYWQLATERETTRYARHLQRMYTNAWTSKQQGYFQVKQDHKTSLYWGRGKSLFTDVLSRWRFSLVPPYPFLSRRRDTLTSLRPVCQLLRQDLVTHESPTLSQLIRR